MTTLAVGKSVIVQRVGNSSAWDFFERHGVVLHRKTDLSGITHAVFVHNNDLVATVPVVLRQEIAALDQESIAKRALSEDSDERRIGVALMQAVAEGFSYPSAGLFVLSAADDPRSSTLVFKPQQANAVLGKSEVANAVINTLLKVVR